MLVFRSLFNITPRRPLNTMVAVQDQDLTTRAEIVRDNLDIVKALRSNPDMVEYQAYSHATESANSHSLTATVSFFIIIIFLVPETLILPFRH